MVDTQDENTGEDIGENTGENTSENTGEDIGENTGLPADDDGWQQRARMALAAAAAGDRLVTYAELADAAGITGKHRINRLTGWLEEELSREVAAGEPLLTARVISRARGGLPAPGFFMKCAELGLYKGPPDGAEAFAFHLNCLR